MAYYIPPDFKLNIEPHGNSKCGKPFFPTLPSTLEAIAKSGSGGPKSVISSVSASVGGVVNAYDSCSLPRNEQQVIDVRRRQKKVSCGVVNPTDELAVVMHKAYLEDGNNLFIRDMKTLREPAVVLASERQLNDLVKFCTDGNQFGIMTVDPTFSLGDFDVTMTTYRHLFLMCKRTSNHPVFIGPVLVHYKKSFSTYLFFACSLIGMRPELKSLRYFGTDGEEALYKAFKSAFPEAVHLLCSLHMKRNIKAKLCELGSGEQLQQMVVDDIFGKQVSSHEVEGLIDCENEKEYEKVLKVLSKKWESKDSHDGGLMHAFTRWFYRYKSILIKTTMLKSTRRDAGLGNPPEHFTTNASESMNSVIKSKVEFKKSELPDFLDKVKDAIDEQERELEKAILGRGKYKLSDKYKKYEVNEDDWFTRMSVAQRETHIKKVSSLPLESKFTAAPKLPTKTSNKPSCNRTLFLQESRNKTAVVADNPDTQCCSRSLSRPSMLSIDVSQFSDSVSIPSNLLGPIWTKARELLDDPSAISAVPGGGAKDRFVRSYSSTRPHLVIAKKNGQYACDGECPNWKSLSICSHAVAAAEKSGDLIEYIGWLTKTKKPSPNLTKLVLTNMPKGRGQKGNAPPRKRKKKMDAKSRKTIAEVIREDSSYMSCSSESETDSRIDGVSQGGIVNTKSDGSLFMKGGDVQPVTGSVFSQSGGNVAFTHSEHGTTLTVSGGSVGTLSSEFHLPRGPPPLVRCVSSSPEVSPFQLAFITGNIAVCRGCKQRYLKPASPPMDLCIRHKEWQEFRSPSGELQSRYGNVYYHCNVACVQARCPSFEPSMLEVHPSLAMQLMPVHTEYLASHMPGRF